jgi:hypothetical protein
LTSAARRGAVLSLAACALAGAGCRRRERAKAPVAPHAAPQLATPVDSSVRAPNGVRIKVEVLNATRNRGLARRVTLYLRDRGFDVVSMGTSGRTQSNTVVLDRSNHPEWAKLLGQALRADTVEERPDTSRYLDATVLIGSEWAAPALPFYP